MKVAIVDYGMGNLGSVRRALTEVGAEVVVAERPEQLDAADRLILPGVGSFGDGMACLEARGWSGTLRKQVLENGKPLLGICLGMQLLASRGTEWGETPGLDLISGEVVRLDTLGCTLRIPHVGWNAIELRGENKLFADVRDGTDFYFVHSFVFRPTLTAQVMAVTNYDIPIVAAVGAGNVFGTQFHPEKSSWAGLRLLRNFIEYKVC